jgi:hypothetical protein
MSCVMMRRCTGRSGAMAMVVVIAVVIAVLPSELGIVTAAAPSSQCLQDLAELQRESYVSHETSELSTSRH